MLLDLQSFRLTAALNLINDPAPGVSNSTTSAGGAVMVQPYQGMVGGHLTLNRTNALQMQDTATGVLYEGLYQYVQFLSTATNNSAVGRSMYWSDRENYVVTSDSTATTSSQFAGVALNPNWTKGNYGWIQVGGKATVLFGTVTKAVPAIGDLVVVGASGVADVLLDATAIVSPNLKLVIGEALVAPATATASLVEIWTLRMVY